jgi:hypothetical protein
MVSRYPGQPSRLDAYRDALSRKLAGDNIEPNAALHFRAPGVASALFNPHGAGAMRGGSMALGSLLLPCDTWHVPGTALPDGNFALLRVDDTVVELATDGVGSRTLWYALTEHELIASSSQRAIVTLLGSFEPNRDALPWMLSSGTLGPTAAWDTRVQRVQAGERVVLDRQRWRLTTAVSPSAFVADDSLSRAEHLERLRAVVTDACQRWSFDARKWVLTLSGGADSRGLLCLLRDRGIDAVTWGLPEASQQNGNDARIARMLAQSFAVPHRFFPITSAADAPDVVLDRFVRVGEGRVDRISGYLDGFQIWKTLFDEGREGVIRGDEAFGSVPVHSPYAARRATSLMTLADYFPPAELATFELPSQPLPAGLMSHSGETLPAWRDRLYHQFRVPTLLAGLTDLKTAYVEVSSPFLATSVLECVRALPDDLRTDKRLWRELVGAQLPNVALATRVAIPSLTNYLRDRRVLEQLLAELNSEHAGAIVAPLLRARCCNALRKALREAPKRHRAERGGSLLARAMPASLREVVRSWRTSRPTLEPLVLAFRAFLATRMHTLLRADAATPPAGLERASNA